jgi:hypothetical protein
MADYWLSNGLFLFICFNYFKFFLGTQEGCHFDVTYQSEMLGLLNEEMERQNLNKSMIYPTSSDENNYSFALLTCSKK